ncbi:MAG: EAL domain-containing protein [Acidocella sp.]|nr:EAL domain-containing protein [Acidocella sp.]
MPLLNTSARTRLVLLIYAALALASAIPLVIAITVLSHATATRAMTRVQVNMNVAWHVLEEQGGDPRIKNNELYFGDRAVNGDDQMVDEIRQMVGGTATIFQGTKRVATNVRNPDGSRGTGTYLAQGVVYNTLVGKHLPYRGVAMVLGTPYYAAYDPIFDKAGHMIGILYVGLRQKPELMAVRDTAIALAASTLLSLIVLGAGVWWLGRRLSARMDQQQGEIETINRQFSAALNNMSQGLCLYDETLHLLVVNKRFAEITCVPSGTITPGMRLHEVMTICGDILQIPPQTISENFDRRISAIDRKKHFAYELPLADGRVIAVTHEPVDTGGFVNTYTDVTQQRQSDAQIAFMATHDALTGLANRNLLHERLNHALAHVARGRNLNILCLDLDHFKTVNDTLGHPVGDKLLCMVAKRLLATVRDADTVARLGGDEFAIIQDNVGRMEDASLLAQRLVEIVGDPYEIEGNHVVIGVSIGMSAAPADGLDADTLLRHADTALYRAKSDGRGRYCYFEPGMDAKLQARRTLENDLRAALDHGEFDLHYQPQVNLDSNKITGFEALLRWQHPTRGQIPPAEFIPIAEDIGLIVTLGEWVMRRACKEASLWPDDIRVAVNLSAAQFKSPGLVRSIKAALTDSRLAPHRLEVEITEGLLLEDDNHNMAVLHELRDFGVRVSMDDFGTGYSSLSYLRSFPFDKIKIDRSFITDLSERPDSMAIVRAVIGLGLSLGIQTTAEGIETASQLSSLRAEGCDEVQGFHLGRPMPAADVRHFLGVSSTA